MEIKCSCNVSYCGRKITLEQQETQFLVFFGSPKLGVNLLLLSLTDAWRIYSYFREALKEKGHAISSHMAVGYCDYLKECITGWKPSVSQKYLTMLDELKTEMIGRG